MTLWGVWENVWEDYEGDNLVAVFSDKDIAGAWARFVAPYKYPNNSRGFSVEEWEPPTVDEFDGELSEDDLESYRLWKAQEESKEKLRIKKQKALEKQWKDEAKQKRKLQKLHETNKQHASVGSGPLPDGTPETTEGVRWGF
jgi:hypothetical protein